MEARHASAAGTHRYGALSIVPTNSKFAVCFDLPPGTKADLGKGEPMVAERGSKPWDVGSVLRIRCWTREATWKIAQPRGTCSHLGDGEELC